MTQANVVLVTGASTGFGRLIAESLARKQYRVFATMRAPEGKNATAARELAALAARESLWLRVLDLDVTSEASVDRAVGDAIAAAGRIDVVVNNAGRLMLGVAESVTLDQAQKFMETNFFGVQRVNRAVLPAMRRQRSGLLLHISSGAGRMVLPGLAFYCASKWALEALAEAYRYELAAQGIDSVIVEPGSFRTAVAENLERAADGARAETYGAIAGVGDKVMTVLDSIAADPRDLAEAVIGIIETPFGERRLRYRLGGSTPGIEQLNELSERVQGQILTAFGLTEITRPVTR